MSEKTLKIITLLFVFVSLANAQALKEKKEFQNPTPCEKINAFMFSNVTLEKISDISDKIHNDGVIYFNQSIVESEISDISVIFPVFELNTDVSFLLTKEILSRFDSNILYRKYQQYYKGIQVEGGGYTEGLVISNGPDYDPCRAANMLAPHFMSDIDLEVDPQFSVEDITNNNEDIIESHLIIGFNENNCEYNLLWEIDFIEGYSKKFNANTGELIATKDNVENMLGGTVNYGQQQIDDSLIDDTRYLKSEDGRVSTYDYGQDFCPGFDETWDEELIPTHGDGGYWFFNISTATIQTHFVMQTVLPEMDALGIEIQNVHSATCRFIGKNAHVFLDQSDMENTYVSFGNLGIAASTTIATMDVAGHELSHVYLEHEIGLTGVFDFETNAIKEGMCDIVGTYVESKYQESQGGQIDWIMGDDVGPVFTNTIERDLQFPINDFGCVLTPGFPDFHKRGLPLGHWYYLVTNGANALDRKDAIDLLFESLAMVGGVTNYNELMDKTLVVAENVYGYGSYEFGKIVMAWDNICVSTGIPIYNGTATGFEIVGPSQFDEESNGAAYSLDGFDINPDYIYKYTITGPKSTEFTSIHGMQGNSQYGPSTLTLIDFPEYPYYPQYIKITCRRVGYPEVSTKRVKIVDGNGDKLTCQEFYEGQGFNIPNFNDTNLKNNILLNSEEKNIHTYKIYSLIGKEVFNGNESAFNAFIPQNNGIFIVIELDGNGIINSTSKKYYSHH